MGNKEIGLKSVAEVGGFILGIGIICDCFSILEMFHFQYIYYTILLSMVLITVFNNLIKLELILCNP